MKASAVAVGDSRPTGLEVPVPGHQRAIVIRHADRGDPAEALEFAVILEPDYSRILDACMQDLTVIGMTATQPARADWYFDFVSPFSYLALHEMAELRGGIDIALRPVLFAGILDYWGQKGPAEIPPKRVWTYRSCIWRAQRMGVPFRLPAGHPFNPLPYLRLALATGPSWPAVTTIFEALWTTGADAADSDQVVELAARLNIPEGRLSAPEIKEQLKTLTREAAATGVFGVPGLVVDGEVFWGADALGFARAYLHDPDILATPEMRRAGNLPVAASRATK